MNIHKDRKKDDVTPAQFKAFYQTLAKSFNYKV